MSDLTRFAVIGTAPSYVMAPWADTTICLASLNDAYRLPGMGRIDEWYDLHPLDHFYYPPVTEGQRTPVYAHQIPYGTYVRPATHLDWLATQSMPVWLHPDHATQHPVSATWPTARPFPKAAVEEQFGSYQMSTPAWMIAHALLRGAREIHMYGIHLSTASEYRDQRPQCEHVLGCVLGTGKRSITTKNGIRHIETADGIVVLPEASPVLQGSHQYAFEPSPSRKLEPLKWELHKATIKRERTIEALKKVRWWVPWVTMTIPGADGAVTRRTVHTSTLQQELWQYEALVSDCQEQLARAGAEG